MKRTGDDIRSLVGLLDSDLAHLGALVDENTRAGERIKKGADDPLDYAALGYTVHNLYSLIENYMLRIAKTFENSLDATSWHTDLLDRMAAEVPGVRPRFFEPSETGPFHELRAFRHVFRNMYRSRLKPEKVLESQRAVPEAVAAFQTAHKRFRAALIELSESLD